MELAILASEIQHQHIEWIHLPQIPCFLIGSEVKKAKKCASFGLFIESCKKEQGFYNNLSTLNSLDYKGRGWFSREPLDKAEAKIQEKMRVDLKFSNKRQ